MTKLVCKSCKKFINGIVKIATTRKKTGNKILMVVNYYDEICFKALNKEKASHGRKNKKRIH